LSKSEENAQRLGNLQRFVAVYFSLACLIMVVASVQPGNSGQVAVFTAPWSDQAAEVVARAGGQIMTTTASGHIAVSRSDQGEFVSDLYASGALFVASSVVAQACLRLGGEIKGIDL